MQNSESRRNYWFGVGLPTSRPSEETLQLAVDVEALGFGQVWIGDHYHSRNPFLLLATIATHTHQIKLCTGITNPFQISPAVLASTIVTLDELSNGRVLLGLGVGDETTLKQIGVYPANPVSAMSQCVAVIRDLWEGKSISGFVGPFQWEGARLKIGPPNRLPIYIGAQNIGMVRLALEKGDGLVMNASSPLDYRWINRIGINERPKSFQTIAYLIVEINNAPSSLLRQLLAQIVAGASNKMLERHEIPLEDADQIIRFVRQGRYQEAGQAITERMIDSFAVVGSLSMVEMRIEELRREKVNGFIFGGPLAEDRREGLRNLAEIAQSFREG
ncbi:MAG: LLM class flavin-dependent oxidoreductase [Candidatus Hodarchaeales archaeon]|jgi:5,10-methylenetetrahydromethanopterin reductase